MRLRALYRRPIFGADGDVWPLSNGLLERPLQSVEQNPTNCSGLSSCSEERVRETSPSVRSAF